MNILFYRIILAALLVILLIATAGLMAKDGSGEKNKDNRENTHNIRVTSAQAVITTVTMTPAADSIDSMTEVEWSLFSAGGGEASSENFGVSVSMGEVAVGFGSSEDFGMSLGFLEIVESSCCGLAGDANNDEAVNVGDAVWMINYVFKSGDAPPCGNEGDANADCALNVGDAVYLINYVFKSGPVPTCGCVD